MKLTVDVIARTALEMLEETGLDGLSMRLLATRLDVQPAALYWHVKNKSQLLDVMAAAIFHLAAEGLEAPRAGVTWQEWTADWVRHLRQAMLRYRDGARIFANGSVAEPALFRATELGLRTLQDAGFEVRPAARSLAALIHYAVGFTIEEQIHCYKSPEPAHTAVDSGRFPLTAQAYVDDNLFDPDTDECFEYGMQIILAGMKATNEAVTP
ncbi:TetR/AcrR family transcriptional regulator C-terminal domain-containing protein [Kibdelosporangium philippinense]|uniref:TetR/AcrR family transcriptional regulator C-terminal domain-containing protein n=1 Tax=Kibdelosporangium philippinense TaxID=211113 RepID=A0ABS8Z7Z3_9PSEU|nr:TetR/AcrR family transcriptional regulator C-terminal domain-containing protein [Kibdelosporangium philippinense]MCE7004006.1 TetR/AcrR family transcriptional regulator C-terminal domain-containing protein [Kibdelosporangium philippinense]